MVVRADLDAVFGFDNIELWADLNNNEVSEEIDARVAWAITLASAHVQAKILLLTYQWSDVETHPLVEHAVVLKAGLLLYSPRSISNEKDAPNPMREYAKMYDQFWKDLQTNMIALADERASRPFPAVIDDYYGDISTPLI